MPTQLKKVAPFLCFDSICCGGHIELCTELIFLAVYLAIGVICSETIVSLFRIGFHTHFIWFSWI